MTYLLRVENFCEKWFRGPLWSELVSFPDCDKNCFWKFIAPVRLSGKVINDIVLTAVIYFHEPTKISNPSTNTRS